MAQERILLVDDNAINRKLTSALLALENYEVVTASSAEEALTLVGEFRPRLILTDVRLTGMDGLEFTRRLRATAEWRTVPIIAVTGLNAPEDEQRAMEAGCNAFLLKPVQSQVLRSLVRKHLQTAAKPAATAAASPTNEEDIIAPLRAEFVSLGRDKCRRLLAMLPVVAPQRSLAPLFDYQELSKALHTWAGGGGTFGLPRITEKAREAETLLKRPFEEVAVALRRLMEELLEEFSRPPVAATPGAARPAAPVALAEPEAAERKPVILVCDDDPLVVSVIKSTLEASGMLCRTADNGRLAFAMARNDKPDAVILDINMPAFDGFQVLDELRRLESTRKLKVMLLTARYEAEDITRGVHHGADDYMAKPFDPAALVDRVRAMLAMP